LTSHDDLPAAARARQLEERLIAAGLTSDDEIDAFLTAYRSRTVREPRTVLGEFGVTLPDTVQISVWDSTSEARYMVLPQRPAGTGGLAADELAAMVTRNGLIGTAPL
jgi:hypothetical protein